MSIEIGKFGKTEAYIELTLDCGKFGELDPETNSLIEVLTQDQALAAVMEILKVFYSDAIVEALRSELDRAE